MDKQSIRALFLKFPQGVHSPLGIFNFSEQELCLTSRHAGETFWNVPAEFESTFTADWLGAKNQDPNFGLENGALYA